VWVEYFSTVQNRWIHLDPCENAYDDPLLYARNWRKKMAYCIAFDEFGGMDVTRRYVRRSQEEGIPRGLVREEHIPLVSHHLFPLLMAGYANFEECSKNVSYNG
jgi:peptide-N4-(N-acetyl-beta-glucosaminyl)asparagine amidase